MMGGERMTQAARERWRIQAPMLAICAVAWILILSWPSGAMRDMSSGAMMHEAMHHEASAHHGIPGMFGGWVLMTVAMMSPLLIAPVLHVHSRSFARRRGRAVLLFLCGYGAVWTVVGSGWLQLTSTIGLRISGWGVVLAGLIAGVWQASPLKQRCLNRCHAHRELAAFGMAADVDAARFGLQHGVWCVASCWVLMLLPMVFMHRQVAVMAVAGVWLFAERLEQPMAPQWSWRLPRKGARIVVHQAKMLASMYSLRNLPVGS